MASKKAWASGVVVLALLAACGAPSEQESLDKARVALDSGDLQTASVHVRNVLQKNANSAEARFLFGRLTLEAGDIAAAETELTKAQKLGYANERLQPLLARLLMAQGQYARVITDFSRVKLSNPQEQAELSASVVAAYVATNQHELAATRLAAAVAAAPGNAALSIVQTRMLSSTGDLAGALAALKPAVATRGPHSVDALRLEGDLLLYGSGDRAGAQAAYRSVLQISPGDIYAQTQLIGSHLSGHEMEAAKKQFAVLAQLHPAHPQTKLMEANIALVGGEYAKAQQLLLPLMNTFKDNTRVLLMASAAALQLNALAQADGYLQKIMVQGAPPPQARQLLATVRLRRGAPAEALQILAPLLQPGSVDADALRLAAEAQLASGDLKNAEALFARALQVQPDDTRARTALALARLAQGERAAPMAALQSIADKDSGTVADMALVSTKLRLGDLDGALASIDAVEKKSPSKSLAPDLRGRVYLLKHDSAKARASFQKAIALDAVYFPSITALAQLDISEGKPEEAQKRYEALLKADPNNVGALVALAGMAARQNMKAQQVVDLLNRAVAVNPNTPGTHVLLIEYWLSRFDPKRALEAAQAGLAANPDDPTLLEALGGAQLANGQTAQALGSFGKLTALQPQSAAAQMLLSDAYLADRKPEAAEQALRQALKLEPELLTAQRELMLLTLQSGQPERAVQIARDVQRQRPRQAIGYQLEGDVHAKARAWDAAFKAYRAGLNKDGGAAVAVRMYSVLKTSKSERDADQFAAEWIGQHPKDTRLRLYMAQEAVRGGNLAQAEQLYKAAAAAEPNNAAAANDLAWVLAKAGKPGAVAAAERALALAPNSANALDTMALALAGNNQLDRAIELSRSAVRLAPDVPLMRLNLAKLYLQANNRQGAKQELAELTKIGNRFAEYPEAVELSKGL